jgi:hypothetical protein
LFCNGQLWWRFYEKYQARLRPAIVENIISLLSCGLLIRGYALYHCSHSACLHTKKIAFSCKSRFCPTCGKKATDQWIATQQAVLPHTAWQHLTFTIPSQLWILFQYNRALLTQLSPLAAKTVQTAARQKHCLPGIFTALHTVGRDLKWHPHVHLSVTRGGLTDDHQAWKPLYFPRHLIMPRWRYAIITLLRQTYARGELVLPPRLQAACPTLADWNRWLDSHYRKAWIVHFAKPHHHPQRNVNYLGRYLKRPPLALSRLKHYDGNTVVFAYLNHTTQRHQTATFDAEAFIKRFVQHIPDKGFRMLRYYGFLAHRVRATLLPTVYQLLEQPEKPMIPIRYPTLLQQSFGLDPLQCILCQSPLRLAGVVIGLSSHQLQPYHQHLAWMKPIPFGSLM